MSNRWTQSHQALLKDLREQAGYDRVAFAKRFAVSVAHLRELEDGGRGSFYSDDIKAYNGHKLLKALGYVPPPEPAPVEMAAEDVAPGSDAGDQGHGSEAAPPALPAAREPAAQEIAPAATEGAAPGDPQPERSRVPLPVTALVLVALATAGIWTAVDWAMPEKPRAQTVTAVGPPGPVPQVAAAPESSPAASEPTQVMATLPAAPAPASAPTPAPAPAVAPDRIQPSESGVACAGASRERAHAYTSPVAYKPSSYVYVQATADVQVCVVDGQNRATVRTLKSGEAVNVPGMPPYLIHTSQWNDLRVFFQGLRVQVDAEAAPRSVILAPYPGG